MDGVLDNWLGPAIGGAVGAGAWVAGQVWDVGTNLVNTVVDVVTNATQPQPYEEWLNAPTNEFKPDGRFKPKTNPGAPGRTAEEIITTAAVQETQTGVSSPLGPEDPTEYKPLPPAPENTDPQAPLNKDFQDIPEKVPPKTIDANVIVSYYSPYNWNPDAADVFSLYPSYKGQNGDGYKGPANQFIYSVVDEQKTDGTTQWKLRVQAFKAGKSVKVWTFNTGDLPATSGDVGLWLSDSRDNKQDDLWAGDSLAFTGIKLRKFSLNTPAVPGQAPAPLPPKTPEILVRPPSNLGDPLTVNDSGSNEVPWTPDLPDIPFLPTLPPGTVPTTPNNPTTVPQIGTNGRPLPSITNVANTYNTTHVINGTKVNSGGIRKDIAGVAKEVGRIEQKTAKLLDRMGTGPGNNFDWAALWIALQALAELFEQPLPAKSYTLTSVCEPTADGEPIPSTTVTLPPEKWADRLISMGDVMPELLQAHKNYKQPTCGSSQTPLEGTWISTRWVSDGNSPGGTKPLRKLLRYRSKSNRTADELQQYWRDFTWQAGAVCVFHKGAWWGTPQIWAATAEEGKRVLRFAAGEAGIDPDQIGEWGVSSSHSSRYGMSGRMRLQQHQGERWVTRRDSPSGLPEL